MTKALSRVSPIALLVASMTIMTTAAAQPNRMLPRPSELLPRPIRLKGCPVTIVEWRASKGAPHTGPSKKGAAVFSATCRKSIAAYPKFLEKEGLTAKRKPGVAFTETMALMPWDISADGTDPRNLNDIADRFRHRTAFYDAAGRFLSIQGYTDRNDNFIYMRNDVFWPDGTPNALTAEIFAHELFHAMNDQYGVFEKLADNDPERVSRDEQLARKFTQFLGF